MTKLDACLDRMDKLTRRFDALVARSDDRDDTKSMPVGLAENPSGTGFRCGTCEWFDEGICRNGNKAINGMKVDPYWCCNLYDNDRMKVVVR